METCNFPRHTGLVTMNITKEKKKKKEKEKWVESHLELSTVSYGHTAKGSCELHD